MINSRDRNRHLQSDLLIKMCKSMGRTCYRRVILRGTWVYFRFNEREREGGGDLDSVTVPD